MLSRFFKYITFISLISALPACQYIDTVVAQTEGQLTFEAKNNWNYAAKIAPTNFLEFFREKEIHSDWLGDPRRFQMMKINKVGQKYPMYLLDPSVDCPETGCRRDHRPFCGTGGCSYFIYIEEEQGKYRKVFEKLFRAEGALDNFFKVSRQMKDGLPACIELNGIDYDTYSKKPTNRDVEREMFVSRYCYNGRQYLLNRLYKVSSPSSNN